MTTVSSGSCRALFEGSTGVRDLEGIYWGIFRQIPPRNRFEIEAFSTIDENATFETIDKLTD